MPRDDWKDCCRCCGQRLIKGLPGYPMFCPPCNDGSTHARDHWCKPHERQQKMQWDQELKRWVSP